MQVGEVMSPALRLPDWVLSTLAFFLILGFPLALIFAWAFEITPEGLKLEKHVQRSESISRITGRKLDFSIIGLLALALGFFAYDKFVLDPSRDAARIDEAVETARLEAGEARAKPAEKSIAVLPFADMSPEGDQESFSDGISEELLNVLARYPGLRVAARTSAFQFKGQNRDVAEIATMLRVNHVLEGSVRKSGTRLRITAQLIEADTGYHLWSEVYDRELTDVFAIQDEISRAIGDALKVTLDLETGSGQVVPTVPEAGDPAAFEAYVAGRQLINKRGRQNIERALAHLRRATDLDPDYAPAHAQLAIAYTLLGKGSGTYGDWTLDQAEARANPHIERALELEPGLPEAHGARALQLMQRREYKAAIAHAQRALELNPSYADAVNWLNISYSGLGRYKESAETLERLLDIDPLSIVGRFNYASALGSRGEFARAHTLADSIAAQSPVASYIARGQIACDFEGEFAGALEWLLKGWALEPADSFTNGYVAWVLGTLGLDVEAQRLRRDMRHWAYSGAAEWSQAISLLRASLEADPSNPEINVNLAQVLHLSGKVAPAQELFEDLLAQAGGGLVYDPAFGSPLPTARAAFGRKLLGDDQGAAALFEGVRTDLGERGRAGMHDGLYYRTAAVIEAAVGEAEAALENIAKAIGAGHRERSLPFEPAFASLLREPRFLELQARLESLLAHETEKALQTLCLDNPTDGKWQPLPETCEGVSRPISPQSR